MHYRTATIEFSTPICQVTCGYRNISLQNMWHRAYASHWIFLTHLSSQSRVISHRSTKLLKLFTFPNLSLTRHKDSLSPAILRLSTKCVSITWHQPKQKLSFLAGTLACLHPSSHSLHLAKNAHYKIFSHSAKQEETPCLLMLSWTAPYGSAGSKASPPPVGKIFPAFLTDTSSPSILHSWREGYLSPTWTRKITCRCFNWLLQSSSERKWRSANKRTAMHLWPHGGQRSIRIASPSLPSHASHHSGPATRDFKYSI